jgi:hypothetical protein
VSENVAKCKYQRRISTRQRCTDEQIEKHVKFGKCVLPLMREFLFSSSQSKKILANIITVFQINEDETVEACG